MPILIPILSSSIHYINESMYDSFSLGSHKHPMEAQTISWQKLKPGRSLETCNRSIKT